MMAEDQNKVVIWYPEAAQLKVAQAATTAQVVQGRDAVTADTSGQDMNVNERPTLLGGEKRALIPASGSMGGMLSMVPSLPEDWSM